MDEQEYFDRISNLFEKVKAEAGTDSELELQDRYRDAEFDLLVEFKLGKDFPADRKEKLRVIHLQSLQGAEAAKTRFLSGEVSREGFVAEMQLITQAMTEAYGAVLSPEEVDTFLGGESGFGGLAIDPGHL